MPIDSTPRLVELEITHACPLACGHCLTQSHPGAGHGAMSLEHWKGAIAQARAAGAHTIQLIGGEPTASPYFLPLIDHVLTAYDDLQLQVYSNLYSVTERHWSAFADPRVALATSYYSDDPAEHDAVTTKRGSHARTRSNIIEALRRGKKLQVGIVKVLPRQRVEQARDELINLGVPGHLATIDRAREVGRANPHPGSPAPVSELCGRCGDGRLAILPDGTVAPCVLGRGLPAGNLLAGQSLRQILTGRDWAEIMQAVPRGPQYGECQPVKSDSNDCTPASTPACAPAYAPPPPNPPKK
jgi:organic radical activating enzyme